MKQTSLEFKYFFKKVVPYGGFKCPDTEFFLCYYPLRRFRWLLALFLMEHRN